VKQIAFCLLAALLGGLAFGTAAPAEGPPSSGPLPPVLNLETAVTWALRNNPELVALRQQHGVAAAGIVIAGTHPFNPLLESRIQSASGPHSAGITNRTPNEQLLFFTLELFGQKRIRQQGARATLARTDWEIAAQEQLLAVRVLRAFRGLLYRQEKLRVAEENVKLNEEAARGVEKQVKLGAKRGADLILANTEVDNARTLIGSARSNLALARAELLRALGATETSLTLEGALEVEFERGELEPLVLAAYENRADLQARRAAVDEADARLRLEIANRFGNPALGPAYVYDPTGVQLIGGQVNVPLPVFNRHKGEIMARQAERDRAVLEVRRYEIQIRQDVQAALTRLDEAQKWAADYKNQVLPNLQRALEGIEKLFAQNDPGADVLRVIDVRRKLLRARDGYLDALWEVSQARADLAIALGEPAMNAGPPCEGPSSRGP
jgi:outer membrane protein TolC